MTKRQTQKPNAAARAPSVLAVLLGAITLAACGGVAADLPEPTPGAPDTADYRAVPGFDTREYPGDEAMRAWLDASPYRWVGYYLPAPCYTGTSWQGRRASLERQGWGIAVLFVGEQDWPSADPVAAAAGADQERPPRCTNSNLTAEQGARDGRAAQDAASDEGFPDGTVVYLDVERVEAVSSELAEYVGAWTTALLEGGRYVPGLYAHARNAPELMDILSERFREAGRSDSPRLWVASTGGFSLRRAPEESGFPAEIWQGALDIDETWGGYTLRIDANVANSAAPSR